MIPTAPLPIRNRLAEMILQALREPEARRELTALAARDATPPDWLQGDDRACWPLVQARAAGACAAFQARRPGPIGSRAEMLDAAAALFDARLYFEVHELLEPAWREAQGAEREALQGLIQIAVGYQHLANRNFAGARALLDEGRRRIEGRTLNGLELDAFGRGVRRSLDRLLQLDWDAVPSFPRQDANVRKETS